MYNAKYLEFLLGGETPLLNVLLETTDRVLSTSHPLDFLAGTVSGSRVGHPMIRKIISSGKPNRTHLNSRVTTVTVRDEFEEQRALAGDGPFASVLDSLGRGDDVHAVGLIRHKMR